MNKKSRKINIFLIISGVLTAVIMCVMNMWLIPEIESGAGGLKCFDMRFFGYTYEQANEFIHALTYKAKEIYLYRQLPLDFIYPIVYGVFLFILNKKFAGNIFSYILTALLVLFDFLENVCSVIMLKSPSFTEGLAFTASTATVVKSALMTLNIVFILVLIIIHTLKNPLRSDKIAH